MTTPLIDALVQYDPTANNNLPYIFQLIRENSENMNYLNSRDKHNATALFIALKKNIYNVARLLAIKPFIDVNGFDTEIKHTLPTTFLAILRNEAKPLIELTKTGTVLPTNSFLKEIDDKIKGLITHVFIPILNNPNWKISDYSEAKDLLKGVMLALYPLYKEYPVSATKNIFRNIALILLTKLVNLNVDIFDDEDQQHTYTAIVLFLPKRNANAFLNLLSSYVLKQNDQKINQYNLTTHIYNTNSPITGNPPTAYITVLGHGMEDFGDRGNPTVMPTEIIDNTLSYSVSPATGVSSFYIKIYPVMNIMRNMENIIGTNRPNSFKEFAEKAMEEYKNTYVSSLDKLHVNPDAKKAKEVALQYLKHSCRIVQPIIKKTFSFRETNNPGIYVNCITNTRIPEQNVRLLNLLIDKDLIAFFALFGIHEQDNRVVRARQLLHTNIVRVGSEIYDFMELPLNLSDDRYVISYPDIYSVFLSVGIEKVGLIDLSCRDCLLDELNRHRIMNVEEIRCANTHFGGKKKKQRKNKTRKL